MKKKATTEQINAAYQSATPAQRRVMIAKDALKQLKAERFTATSGVWADVKREDEESIECPLIYDPLQPFLLDPKTTCQCCGVGAIFLSYVRLANNATYADADDFGTISNALPDWPKENLRLIELAFEKGSGGFTATNDEETRAEDFGFDIDYDSIDNIYPASQETKDNARLVAILNNIIANNGTFDPSRS